MKVGWICLGLISLVAALTTRAAEPSPLEQVMRRWRGERSHWAFTQLVREYEDRGGRELKQERLERYDPSLRGISRWRLISIDGRAPTPDEWTAWSKRANRPRRHADAEIEDHFDFAHARVREETAQLVRYELPLRNDVEWLFPLHKIELLVTIDKRGPALAEVQVRLDGPFRVALGIARLLDLEVDLQLRAPAGTLDPAAARPSGVARATVAKPSGRVEYEWSAFQRVTPHSDFAVGGARTED